jgi:glucose/mannose transport system substrate-binding protein
MRLHVSLMAGVALSVLLAGGAAAQDKPKAEVMHQWTSAGEAAAIKVIADAYNAAGGEWVDTAITGGDALMAGELARLTGGNPPAAMQFPAGDEMIALVEQGLLRPLDDIFAETGFDKVLPAAFLESISYEGHIYAIPVNNHGQSWIWWNTEVLKAAGVEPPVTWEDAFAGMQKVKDSGKIGIAIGGQNWQNRIMFIGVLATKGGAELYNKVFEDRDDAAIRSPEFKEVVETFLKIRDYADEGNINRDWNVAANMAITGEAGFYIQGDWAKGEFAAAGQTPGVEYGCTILGDGTTHNFIMSSDAFVFPAGDAALTEAQDLLARVMIDQKVQAGFNAAKGSLPARVDVDPSLVDACTAYGLEQMNKPEQQLLSLEFFGSGDYSGAIDDLIGQVWTNPAMTADEFVEQFATISATIP